MMGTAAAATLGIVTGRGNGPAPVEATVAEGAGFSAALGASAAEAGEVVLSDAADETPAADSLPTELPLLASLLLLELPVPDDGASEAKASEVAPAGTGLVRTGRPTQVLPLVEGIPQPATPDTDAGQDTAAATPGLTGRADAKPGSESLLQQLAQAGGGVLRDSAPEARIAVVEPGVASVNPATTLPVSTAPALPPGPTPALEHTLRSAVGTARWAADLGSTLVTMTTRGQHEGSLTLTPEHLGPLEVRISVTQQSTHVWFGSQHADTRAALAEALPRLRELFAEAGLSLGQAGISHEAPRQQAQARGEAGARGDAAIPKTDSITVTGSRVTSGLLDLYA